MLVAAGRGERLGEDRPKAFARLGGLPLLAESLRRLDASDWIDGIVVVAPPEWEEPAILVAEEIGASKVAACVTGGETRSASVRAGLAEVPDEAAVVLVHDAARPLLPPDLVQRLAGGARRRASTAPCRRCRSPTRSSGCATASWSRRPPATSSWPFRPRRRSSPRSCGAAAGGEGSDCASLVEAAGGRVTVVAGDERLLKMTTPGRPPPGRGDAAAGAE